MGVVLQIGSITPRFDANLDAVRLWEQPDALAFLQSRGADFTVAATASNYGFKAETMDAMPNLKAICSFGVGYDSIDVAAAKARGIAVSNTPGVLDDCVADLALALILAVARGVVSGDRYVREGKWLQGEMPLGVQVTGKKLGIVGLGRIGKAVARRAEAFGMQIRYHNRKPDPSVPFAYEPSAASLAAFADFLVLTCSGGQGTRNLIGALELEALGPKGYLINVSRGSVVDEAALISALEGGRIAGAGLDVFANEPRVPEALLTMGNVVVLPHIGSASHETRLAMENLVLENVRRFLETGALVTPV
jgi:lactate dehydrogenase-like 2-hydroxyacid dehydrogenase